MKKNGFTLAEILITLGLIGIIAALTMPTLLISTQNDVHAKTLSSIVHDLENAFTTMMSKEGYDTLRETDFYKKGMDANDESTASDLLGQYITLDRASSSPGALYDGSTTVKKLSGSGTDNLFDYITFRTKQGAILNFGKGSNTNIKEIDAISSGLSMTNSPLEVIIDVNGPKKPNIIGRDVFGFAVGNDGLLYPRGSADYKKIYGTSYTCSASGDGWGCAADLLKNNYKMKY